MVLRGTCRAVTLGQLILQRRHRRVQLIDSILQRRHRRVHLIDIIPHILHVNRLLLADELALDVARIGAPLASLVSDQQRTTLASEPRLAASPLGHGHVGTVHLPLVLLRVWVLLVVGAHAEPSLVTERLNQPVRLVLRGRPGQSAAVLSAPVLGFVIGGVHRSQDEVLAVRRRHP